jgi:uncharacterized protein (TIGR02147 family)
MEMQVEIQATVSVFDFVNFQEFLRALLRQLKGEKYFSYRYLERISGLSRSYFKLLLDGKRNLTPKAAAKLAKALKLSRKEAAYLEALVLYNQAEGDEERDRYFERLLALRPPLPIRDFSADQYECFTKTYFTEIRELAALPGFVEDLNWIRRRLRRPLRNKEIRHAVAVLERLGLLERTKDGTLTHSGTTMATPVEAPSLDIFNYHRQLLSEAKDAIMNAPYDEWDVGAMTIPMPKAALPQVMEMLRECRERIADFINRGDKDFHEVFQINMQMFPVSRRNRPDDDKG